MKRPFLEALCTFDSNICMDAFNFRTITVGLCEIECESVLTVSVNLPGTEPDSEFREALSLSL